MEQGISYREARDMGFKTSKRLWKVSLLNRPDLKRGRKPLSTVLIGYMVDILAKIVRNKIFLMNKNYYSILFNHQRNQNLMYMKVFKRSCE